MKQTKLIMGMPITVEVHDIGVTPQDLKEIFTYFRSVDEQFSPYKKTSEVSKINRNELSLSQVSREMREVIELAEQTKLQTNGFFDVYYNGYFDPSGIVKGWAIQHAATMLKEKGLNDFAVNAGGDVQVSGISSTGEYWKIGIKNPFRVDEIVKVVHIKDQGVATSGNYIRGEHIHTPKKVRRGGKNMSSLTVIGPTICDADRFATAGFAMGEKGIYFIDSLDGFEGYMIDSDGIATMTRGFAKYLC